MRKFKRYGVKQLSRLKRHLKSYARSAAPEDLHSIRVEIKKTKSFLLAIGVSHTSFKAHRHYKPFRDIFRKAGAIRHPQVMRQLCQRYGLEDLVPTVNEADERARVMAFQTEVPAFLRSVERGRKLVETYADSVSKKQLEKYIHKLMRYLKKKLYPDPDFQNLHKHRKTIKQIIYLSSVLDSPGKRCIRELKALEELAGQHHDKQLMMALLMDLPENQREELKAACELDESEINRKVCHLYK